MQLEEVNKQIEYLLKVKGVLEREPNGFHEEVFLLYIKTNRTADVAKLLNEKGYRGTTPAGRRKLISTDITDILESTEAKSEVNEDLYKLVNSIRRSKRVKNYLGGNY